MGVNLALIILPTYPELQEAEAGVRSKICAASWMTLRRNSSSPSDTSSVCWWRLFYGPVEVDFKLIMPSGMGGRSLQSLSFISGLTPNGDTLLAQLTRMIFYVCTVQHSVMTEESRVVCKGQFYFQTLQLFFTCSRTEYYTESLV